MSDGFREYINSKGMAINAGTSPAFLQLIKDAWQAARSLSLKEIERLKEELVQVKCDKVDEWFGIKKKFVKLEASNKVLRGACENWIKWEDVQIKKHGNYVGAEINELITTARQALLDSDEVIK